MFFICNKIIVDLVIFWLCLQVVLFKNYNIHHLKLYMQFLKSFSQVDCRKIFTFRPDSS